MTTATMKSDAQIQSEVLAELKWGSTVSETEVGVQVHNGIVTLNGSVDSYPKKLAARDAAHRVIGVLDVVDQMRIKLQSAWERSDEDVAVAVRMSLKWDTLVPDDQITSTVSNGVVTLMGTVAIWAERTDAERAIVRLTGVRGVINKISVAARPAHPVEIKQQIEAVLQRQALREAKRIHVEVNDGVVTLTGTLRSWTEKNAIERVVGSGPGVRRVEDRTVVDTCG